MAQTKSIQKVADCAAKLQPEAGREQRALRRGEQVVGHDGSDSHRGGDEQEGRLVGEYAERGAGVGDVGDAKPAILWDRLSGQEIGSYQAFGELVANEDQHGNRKKEGAAAEA